MSSSTYISIASYPLPVGWKCTKCGKFNITTCYVKENASITKQGGFHGREASESVSAQAKDQLMFRLIELTADTEKKWYDPVFNTCVCKNCSHREPWASSKKEGCLAPLCYLISFWSAVAAIAFLFAKSWSSVIFLTGLIAVLLTTATLFTKYVEKKNKELEEIFPMLKPIERPVVAPNVNILRMKMIVMFAQSPEDIVAINNTVQRGRWKK